MYREIDYMPLGITLDGFHTLPKNESYALGGRYGRLKVGGFPGIRAEIPGRPGERFR